MQSTSARRLYPRRQAQRFQHIPHEAGGFDNLLPRHLRSRIEVPDDAIGALDVVRRRIPRVDFDDAHLRERYDRFD
jgi:hypothetical protein